MKAKPREIRLDRAFTLKLSLKELALIRQGAAIKSTNMSAFVRESVRRELCRMSLMDQETTKALTAIPA